MLGAYAAATVGRDAPDRLPSGPKGITALRSAAAAEWRRSRLESDRAWPFSRGARTSSASCPAGQIRTPDARFRSGGATDGRFCTPGAKQGRERRPDRFQTAVTCTQSKGSRGHGPSYAPGVRGSRRAYLRAYPLAARDRRTLAAQPRLRYRPSVVWAISNVARARPRSPSATIHRPGDRVGGRIQSRSCARSKTRKPQADDADEQRNQIRLPSLEGHRPIAGRIGQRHEGERRERREEHEDPGRLECVAGQRRQPTDLVARRVPGQHATDEHHDGRDRGNPPAPSKGIAIHRQGWVTDSRKRWDEGRRRSEGYGRARRNRGRSPRRTGPES